MNPMSRPHPAHVPAHVPTLTEVIEVDALAGSGAASPATAMPASAPAAGPSQPIPLDSLPLLEGQLAQRVLNDVQRQIDGMLEFRLREALAPVLARHSEAIVRDLKDELSRTMRDVVARSVAQEVAKLRPR